MKVRNNQETNFGVETKAQGRQTPKKQRSVETTFQSFQRSVLHQNVDKTGASSSQKGISTHKQLAL